MMSRSVAPVANCGSNTVIWNSQHSCEVRFFAGDLEMTMALMATPPDISSGGVAMNFF